MAKMNVAATGGENAINSNSAVPDSNTLTNRV